MLVNSFMSVSSDMKDEERRAAVEEARRERMVLKSMNRLKIQYH